MEEAKIPVLSVLKKGTILNFFFLNTPPPGTSNPLSPSADQELILIGRHPDCHIVVDHPSISRFHLAILQKSSLQKLLVTDRSSVHGTWVSGKRIEPNTPVELCEGDTFRLGASTRIYRLHWMPLSHAFEMEMPMSPLIEEASDSMDSDEVLQHENSNEVRFSDIIPSAPPQLEILKDPFPGHVIAGDLEEVGQSLTGKDMFTHSSCFSSIAPSLNFASFSGPLEDVTGYSDNVVANALQPSRGLDQKTKPSSLLSRRNKLIRVLQIERTREENRNEIMSATVCSEIKEQLVGAFTGENDGATNSVAHLTEVNAEEEEEPFISDQENRTPVNSISSKLLRSGRRIDRSFSLCNTDDFEIEEQVAMSSGEEKIPSGLLSESDPVEEEEDLYVSDKANVSPVNSNGSKVLKKNHEIERSPLSSFSLFNKYDLEIEQQKHGVIEVGKEKEEEICGSNMENLTPVNCIKPKSLKNNREFDRLPLEEVTGSSDNIVANVLQPSRRLDQKTKPSSLLSRRNKLIRVLQIERTREENRCEIMSATMCSEIKEQLVGAFTGENDGVANSVALLTEVSAEEEEEPFISDKENRTPVNSISSKLLKSGRRIDRPFSLCNTDDLEIEEQKVMSSGEEKTPSALLSESDPVEEEEDLYVSDKANVSPVNSNCCKELKKKHEIERSPLSSFSLFNKYDLEIEQQKLGVSEVGKEKAEEICGSNMENLTPVNCIESKCLKNNRELERLPLGSFSICKLDREHSDSEKENRMVMNRFKSSYLKAENLFMKEPKVSMFCSVNNMGPVFSPAIKLQRTLKAQQSPLSEKKKLNVEEICFLSNKEKTSEVPNPLKMKKAASRDLLKDKLFSDQGKNPEAPSSLKTKKSFTRDLLKAESQGNSALASDRENLTPQNSICVESKKVLSENLGKTDADAMNDEIYENKSFPSKDGFLSDKEKTREVLNTLKMKKSTARDLLMAESEESETFFSDKENMTPQNLKCMQSKKVLSEIHGKSEGETMNRRKERIPFQPLLECSPLRSSALASYVNNDHDDNCCNKDAKNVQKPEENFFDSHNKEELPHMPEREKKKWYFVVDVGCLLTEESKKSLQLLEGIRGTQLIIPRIVIRELDHLKRCQGILSRGTKASSILQWIEECMVKSSWWIHVQSTAETFPATPTALVAPRSLGDGGTVFSTTSFNLTGFSTCGSLMEIVSPTTEDHILDCALLFKRLKSDGQLILLTSSTTLRIKAMAEGLLCETPKEFRESLVNPFSKRFLWMESSPRGSTWSCLEEVVLPENCHKQFAAAVRSPKGEGTVKGLKLILLHSSYFGTTYLI